MAKPPTKKPTVPAVKTETPATAAADLTPKGRARKAVLVPYTPNQLIELFGADTKVLVGRKAVDELRLKQLKEAHGL